MSNYIDEYLLRLGATVDQAGLTRFQNAIRDTAAAVDLTAAGMGKAMFGVQAEIVGGFTAIGTTALTMVDKVAMADQEYRLFAMHMFMTKDAARSLKIAMDTLGEPLENLAWDAELRGRTRQLIEDQRRMALELGPDFNATMKKIRDVRFEFQRMEVETKYLVMKVVEDFFNALGLGPDKLLATLRAFNEWLIKNLPWVSKWLVQHFMPIWHDIERLAMATGLAMKGALDLFVRFIGLLSGDQSLETGTVGFEQLATSIDDVAKMLAGVATFIANTETMLENLTKAITGADDAMKSWKATGDSMTTKDWATLEGAVGGFVIGGKWGAVIGATAGRKLVGAFESTATSSPIIMRGAQGRDYVNQIISMYPSLAGVDPNLVHAVMMAESGGRQADARTGQILTSKTGALGLMQLLPSTAKELGVNPYDPQQNIAGGALYLKELLEHYHGNVAYAVGAYHEGQAKMDAILAGHAVMSEKGRQEVSTVLTSIGQVNIHVHVDKTNATAKDIGDAGVRSLMDYLHGKSAARTQRNLTQVQGTYGWSAP
jgi:Transglycosylase SLT domain